MKNLLVALFVLLGLGIHSQAEEPLPRVVIPRAQNWYQFLDAIQKMSAKSYHRNIDPWYLTREVLKYGPKQEKNFKKINRTNKNLNLEKQIEKQKEKQSDEQWIAYTRALKVCIETTPIWNDETQKYQLGLLGSWCEEMKASANTLRFLSYARTQNLEIDALLKDGPKVKQLIEEMLESGFLNDPYH